MEKNSTTQKFYYYSTGYDSNGNGGPEVGDECIVVTAQTCNEAVHLLPEPHRSKVLAQWKKCKKQLANDPNYDASCFGECIAATCGWGWNFVLFNEEEYNAFLENKEHEAFLRHG